MNQTNDDLYWSEWLAEYKKYLIGAIAAFLLLLVGLWSLIGNGASQNDYLTASNQFFLFRKAVSNPATSKTDALTELDKLSALMDKYPVLHEKYDGDIAQLLFASGQEEKALPFAKRFLKLDFDPSVAAYKTFAEQSIEIAGKNIPKAIELGNTIAQNASPTSGLYAFDAFQTTLLEKSQGNTDLARQAWARLKGSLHEPSFQTISPLFTMGNVTLTQFISSQN